MRVWRSTTRLINRIQQGFKNLWARAANEYNAKQKIRETLTTLIDVLWTGTLIWAAITYHNILGYGIAAYLTKYYAEWLVTLIRTGTTSNSDNGDSVNELSHEQT